MEWSCQKRINNVTNSKETETDLVRITLCVIGVMVVKSKLTIEQGNKGSMELFTHSITFLTLSDRQVDDNVGAW